MEERLCQDCSLAIFHMVLPKRIFSNGCNREDLILLHSTGGRVTHPWLKGPPTGKRVRDLPITPEKLLLARSQIRELVCGMWKSKNRFRVKDKVKPAENER